MNGVTIKEVLDLLDLEAIEVNIFRGVSPKDRWQRVFGGQVLGQALVAAYRTVDERVCHSLHAYFIRPGDPKVPILYEVDRARDGKSFTTRRVVAIQHGEQIFNMSASFQVPETGLEHQFDMPKVPAPEGLESEEDRRRALGASAAGDSARATLRGRDRSTFGRSNDDDDLLNPTKAPPYQNVWIKANGEMPQRSGDAPVRAGVRVRYDAARHVFDAARHQLVLGPAAIGEPRSRDVVSSSVSRRRVAALCAGQSERCGRARVQSRQPVYARRQAGRVRRARGTDPPAQSG